MSTQKTILVVISLLLLITATQFSCSESGNEESTVVDSTIQQTVWMGPPANQIPYYSREDGKLIWYGHELIANTSKYLGPKGSVMQITNGMNCQNCHLDAGTKPWGNNYSAVYTTYPKFRERSGGIETIYKRVNDCMERSLNGTALDSNSNKVTVALVGKVGTLHVIRAVADSGGSTESAGQPGHDPAPGQGRLRGTVDYRTGASGRFAAGQAHAQARPGGGVRRQ